MDASTTEDWEGRKQGADSLYGTDSDTDSDMDNGGLARGRQSQPFSRAISEVPKADHSSSFAPALIHHNEKVSKIYPAQPLKQRAGKVMTYEEDLQYMEEYYKWLEEDEQGEPHEVVLDDFMQKGWRQKEPCLVKRHFSWNSLPTERPCRVVSVYPRQSVARTLLRSPQVTPFC